MIEVKNSKGEVIFVYEGERRMFDDANLSGVNLADAELEGAWFNDANLSYANLEGADLYWAALLDANLENANLRSVRFTGSLLAGANLSRADLSNANFGFDNVGGRTDLRSANLTDCIISGTIFEGAMYDSKTKFPNGFDPEKHHMKLEPDY